MPLEQIIQNKNNLYKKILLIAYHFPPDPAVGGLRVAGFTKYLPLYGWKPYILTIKERYLEKKDTGSLKDLQNIKIFRTYKFPTILECYLKIKTIYFSILAKRKVTFKELLYLYEISKDAPKSIESAIKKLKRYFVSLFITLPDTERNWIIPAMIRAFREIKREKIKIILTSGPPHSVHLIGLLIAMFMNVKWVADFRDPWMTPFNKRLYPTSSLSILIEKSLEKKILKNANLVITTTKKLADKLKENHNTLPKAKFVFLPNGYDKRDLSYLNDLKKYDTFTISYTGSIYFGRSPEPLFRAIKELATENRLKLTDLRIKLIGNCQFIGGRLTSDVVSSYGFDTVVEISDYVPYKKALEVIKKSHVALLLAPNQPYQIPAKVYDYMGTGTKILALTGEGATAELINSTGIGKAVDPANIQGIKDYVYSSALNIQNQESNREIICDRYNRKNIVKYLALELNRITDYCFQSARKPL
jgi:hypothetical protein